METVKIIIAPKFPWTMRLGRNSSWANSMKLLCRVLFYFPSSTFHFLKHPFGILLVGLITFPLAVLFVVCNLPFTIVMGLCGLLNEPTVVEETTPVETKENNNV